MKELFNILSDVSSLFTEKRFIYQLPKGNESVQNTQETQRTNEKPKFADKSAEYQAKTDLANEKEGRNYFKEIKRAIKDDTLIDRINSTGEKILSDKTNPDRFKQYKNLMTEVYSSYFLAKAQAMKKAKMAGEAIVTVKDADYIPRIDKAINKQEELLAKKDKNKGKNMLASDELRK